MPAKRVNALRHCMGAAMLVLTLSGCDMIQQQLGIEDPGAKAARTDAEGKAVGGACRQSGRAIEDCYSIYSWLPKAPIYEGWRDMDAYMRENKIETVEPQLPPASAPGTRRRAATSGGTASEAKPDRSAAEKH
ncbi:hypothetical protein [Propionivibrio sp.]|uniref:hypothetical protein n=1 Tax=Propionivibrio sp. TaxID=2212460 RepID=UPI0026360B31|nr:hypothetical protein [Propionivibrio sp.]